MSCLATTDKALQIIETADTCFYDLNNKNKAETMAAWTDHGDDRIPWDKTEANLSGFCVLGTRSSINQEPEVFLNTMPDAVYKIGFTIAEAGAISSSSILSFSYLDQKPVVSDNVADYEIHFTKDFLGKAALSLSEKIGLFKRQLPAKFLVSQNQEWRIIEIFKSMIDECIEISFGKKEMIKTLIHQLLLFTRRLKTID
jgi:hypothetical protein